MKTRKAMFFIAAAAACPVVLFAHMTGADPRLTGAPGDDPDACTSCHLGTRLNAGGGAVKIILPGAAVYTPGVKQRIQVEVSDAARRRWGFEFTARLVSDLTNGQAGDLSSVDGNTRVMCESGSPKPCATAGTIQFITHTLAGTRNGTTGGATFEFDWTPPDTDLGNIRFYAAGNAASGDSTNSGDHIYTTSVELAPAAVPPKPAISSDRGVRNAASALAGIAQNAWIIITGTNLATVTRTWTADDMASGGLPTSLEGVSVTVNGKPAFVEYVSPSRINALAPADEALGPVEVRVTFNGQTSDAFTAGLDPFAPALFTYDGKYAATTTGENTRLDRAATFFSAPGPPPAIKTGDTVSLYATGFGPADLTTPLTVTIGGLPATVSFAGPADGSPGIYRLDVQVPDGLPDGDQQVVVEIGGVTSPAGADCCYLSLGARD